MSEDLKPCPRCGASAEAYKAFPKADEGWVIGVEHSEDCHDRGWEGYCYATQAEAIAAWNTRADSADLASLRAKAEALAEDLRWLQHFADVRSQDDSKTFARVNRGALRTIRDRSLAAVAAWEAARAPEPGSAG